MLGNSQDAEDTTQEAFLAAYRNWGRFRADAQVSMWLYRIVIKAALMKIRKEQRHPLLTDTGYADMEVADWAPDLEEATVTKELRGAVEEGVGMLPPDLRAAVVLRDIQELSDTEAAEILGLSISAFKARLHRGRVLLRKQLEKYFHH